jgi:hypothetical protein
MYKEFIPFSTLYNHPDPPPKAKLKGKITDAHPFYTLDAAGTVRRRDPKPIPRQTDKLNFAREPRTPRRKSL